MNKDKEMVHCIVIIIKIYTMNTLIIDMSRVVMKTPLCSSVSMSGEGTITMLLSSCVIADVREMEYIEAECKLHCSLIVSVSFCRDTHRLLFSLVSVTFGRAPGSARDDTSALTAVSVLASCGQGWIFMIKWES